MDGREMGALVPESFDAILLDAPCSCEGNIRKEWRHEMRIACQANAFAHICPKIPHFTCKCMTKYWNQSLKLWVCCFVLRPLARNLKCRLVFRWWQHLLQSGLRLSLSSTRSYPCVFSILKTRQGVFSSRCCIILYPVHSCSYFFHSLEYRWCRLSHPIATGLACRSPLLCFVELPHLGQRIRWWLGREKVCYPGNILEHLGTSWNILEHLGTSWNILEHLGTSWNILEHLGTSWNILEHLGTSWNSGEASQNQNRCLPSVWLCFYAFASLCAVQCMFLCFALCVCDTSLFICGF